MIELYNEDCFKTMSLLDDNSIDLVLTSPFYNTNKKAGKNKTLGNTKVKDGQYDYVRYDTHVDNMTNEEYNNYTVKLFNEFDRIINKNGCVLYNISYGAENTNGMFEAINAIITSTTFSIADVITWKKSSALPNSCSSNRLTRITEFVFVFCRKSEMLTCPFNKATYSSELCEKLLTLYAPEDAYIYDPFMGSGTTAVACERLGLHCIGSEISTNQVKFSVDRLRKEFDYLEDEQLYYELQSAEVG